MWKDCETELDYLDFDYLVNVLNSFIKYPTSVFQAREFRRASYLE